MRYSERGSANWPFIISLVLLLVLGFLWFDQKSQLDEKTVEAATHKAEATKNNELMTEREIKLDQISELVGFRTDTKVPGHTWTDSEALRPHLSPDGDGALKQWRAEAYVEILLNLYKKHEAEKKDGVPLKVPVISQEFKDKLAELLAKLPKPPVVADDEDNETEQARYKADLLDYNKKWEEYVKAFEELAKMQDWPAFARVVQPTLGIELDPKTPVRFSYFEQGNVPGTIEELLRQPGPMLREMRLAFEMNKKADELEKKSLRDQLLAAQQSADNPDTNALGLKQKLEAEEAKHKEDVDKLTKDVADANANAEKFRVEATGAQQALAAAKEDAKKTVTGLTTTQKALEDRIRLDKEIRDLEIQRNDKDGEILDASSSLGTGAINLGSADKVFPGLKFEVSYIGRGGIRMPKGTVRVLRVVDAHYSQVAIETQVSDGAPIGRGDWIANPFYSATKAIHVYLAGDLRKYPKQIATRRLQEMGAIVDEKLALNTDYVVVPANLTAAPAAPAADGAAPEGGAEKSQYDQLAAMAKNFGATLITERMLEHFLGY